MTADDQPRSYAEGNTYCGSLHRPTGRECGKHARHDGPHVAFRRTGRVADGTPRVERIEWW